MFHSQKGGEVQEHYPAAINHSYGSMLHLGQHLCVQVTWYPELGSSLGDLTCLHNILLLVRGTLMAVPGFSNSAILERSDLEFSLLIKTQAIHRRLSGNFNLAST